jgi:hypothetical protein
VEVWGADVPPEGELQRIEVGGGRSRRVPAVAVVALAALVVAGLVLGGGDDDPTSAPPQDRASSTTLERASTSTTRPRSSTTSSTSTTAVLGPILPQATGGALVIPDQSSRWWTWLDLDSGMRREVDVRLGVDDAYSAVPVRGGLVLPRGGNAAFMPLPEGEPVDLGPADQVVSAGLPDSVWLLRSGSGSGLPGESGTVARLVGLDGSIRATVAVPQLSYAFGATAEGLIFSAGGRAYLAGPDGVEQLGVGEVLSVTDPYVALLTCDEEVRCAPELLDTRTGQRRSLPAIPYPYPYGVSVLIAPDGRVAVIRYDQVEELTVYAASGNVVGSAEGSLANGNVRWLPGDSGLVTAQPLSIVRPDGAGGLVRVAIEGADDLRADLVLVIPG